MWYLCFMGELSLKVKGVKLWYGMLVAVLQTEGLGHVNGVWAQIQNTSQLNFDSMIIELLLNDDYYLVFH